MVVKCNEEVVAKVITGDNNDLTEYMTMQYLAARAPNIPALKPHDLIRFRILLHYLHVIYSRHDISAGLAQSATPGEALNTATAR
ncbi:hypothetical protein EMPG_16103 [Blastomyces silverae]|uniref:Uncharacterized protein n=1 Tax=Blastomyces silverae TaxID=2060906 RepID=A0A0H1BAJ4_9EURO|nr:hypothetical protein EMPG_16103 [Blastomyces silverae]